MARVKTTLLQWASAPDPVAFQELHFPVQLSRVTVNPIKLETGLRPNSAGSPYTLLLRIEAIGFPTFRLLVYYSNNNRV